MSNPSKNLLPRGFFAAPPLPPPPRRQDEAPPGIHYDYSNSHLAGAVSYPKNSNINNCPPELSQKRLRDDPPLFHCDACNLSLESQSALQAHLSSHTRCAQCGFAAAPKVVKAHFEAIHGRFAGSGFKTITVAIPGCPVQRFRICVGNNPEDVRKWIDERKRRFPRQMRAQNQVHESSQGREAQQNEQKGLSSLLEGYSSSDSEASASCKQKAPTTTTAPTHSLNAVSFGEAGMQETNAETKKRGVCRFFARDGKCRNGDNCAFLHEAPAARPTRRIQANTRDRTKESLLGKLLLNDMKRESSLTIQLLEYIVKSDFLGKKLP